MSLGIGIGIASTFIGDTTTSGGAIFIITEGSDFVITESGDSVIIE